MPNTNITRLEAAGMLESSAISAQDRQVIEELTSDEVTVLIQIATRLSPDDPTAVYAKDLRTGRLRILFPL